MAALAAIPSRGISTANDAAVRPPSLIPGTGLHGGHRFLSTGFRVVRGQGGKKTVSLQSHSEGEEDEANPKENKDDQIEDADKLPE